MCDDTVPIAEDFFDGWFEDDERRNDFHCLMYGTEEASAARHTKEYMLELSRYFWNLLSDSFCCFRIDMIILHIYFFGR